MYIIEFNLQGLKYWMAEFGTKKKHSFLTGIRDNAKKFTDKEEAKSWALAESTLPAKIIPI